MNYRAPLLFDARKIAAARELARGGHRAIPGMMPARMLAGLACGCNVNYSGGGLKGYREAVLKGPHKTRLNGIAQSPASGTPALIPVSNRSAIAAAVRLFAKRTPPQLQGFGEDTTRVQSTAQYAALGAKAGSVIPLVGTVIGAVVGAVVGWLATKKKPVRASAEQIAQCKALMNEYMGYASQMPTQPIPLDPTQLKELNWCLDALYGSKVGLKDPRYFDPDVDAIFIPLARQIVRLIYETPVGSTVNLGKLSVRIGKQTFSFAGYSFVNPVFTDLKTFTDQTFVPIAVQLCKDTAGKGAGGCEAYYAQTPEFRRWLFDLLGWAARTELPNISEGDLKAASQVAATVPNASAKDVVTAVEQIIGRTVQSGETAAMLTPATGPPPALPIVPTGPPTSAPPASGIVPPTFATPLIPAAPTLPAPGFELPSFAPQPYAPYSPLAPTAKTQGTVATATNWYENPWLLGGGTLAIGAMLWTQRRNRK